MKILILILLLTPNLVFSSILGSSSPKFVQVQTGVGEIAFIDIDKLEIVYGYVESEDVYKHVAHVGKYYPTEKDIEGKYKVIFLTIVEYKFKSKKEFLKWIETVRPTKKCLTIDGLGKCN